MILPPGSLAEVATAVGESLNLNGSQLDFQEEWARVKALTGRAKTSISDGRSKERCEEAASLRKRWSTSAEAVWAALEAAESEVRTRGPGNVQEATRILKAASTARACGALENLVNTDIPAHEAEADRERVRHRHVLSRKLTADLLLLDLQKLAPGEDATLREVRGRLEDATTHLAGRNDEKAEEAVEDALVGLARVQGPLSALTAAGDQGVLIDQLHALRDDLLSSPLDAGTQEALLEGLRDAAAQLNEGGTPARRQQIAEVAKSKTDKIEEDFKNALKQFDELARKFNGVLDSAMRTLNALSRIAAPKDTVDLQADLDRLHGCSGRPTEADLVAIEELAKRLGAVRRRFETDLAAAAVSLAGLDGFKGRIMALAAWRRTLATRFEFPTELDDLDRDHRRFVDAVQAREIAAHRLSPAIEGLLTALGEDEEAKADREGITDKLRDACGEVKGALAPVRASLEELRQGLVDAGTRIAQSSAQDPRSFQALEGELLRVMKTWEAVAASARKEGDVKNQPTLKALEGLKRKLDVALGEEQGGPTSESTVLASALGRYQDAYQEALDGVGAAVAVQRETDTVPADAMSAICKIHVESTKTQGDLRALEDCTAEQKAQAAVLASFINGQKTMIIVSQKALVAQLASISESLEAVAKAGTPSVFHPRRRSRVQKEKKYAEFLSTTLVPELARFETVEHLTLLDDALNRTVELKADVEAISASVVDGKPRKGSAGKTFSDVRRQLDLAREQLQNSRLKKFRPAARAALAKKLSEIEGNALDRPTRESLKDTAILLAPDGIPAEVGRAIQDAKERREFDASAKELKKKLKSSARTFKRKFTTEQLKKADDAGLGVPSGANAKAYLQSLVDRLNGLTKVSREEGAVSDTLPKLAELKAEVDAVINEPAKALEGVLSLEKTNRDKEQQRSEFEAARRAALIEARNLLAGGDSPKEEKKKHLKGIERDLEAAEGTFEATGSLKDAQQLIGVALQKAKHYGQGSEQARASYARKDLQKLGNDWAGAVRDFDAKVTVALDAVMPFAERKGIEPAPVVISRVAEVRRRLESMFDPEAFETAIDRLKERPGPSGRGEARAVREAALARIRGYLALLEGDPDIRLLEEAPSGGFDHASVPLKRSLTMLERTFLVSVPAGE